MKKQSKKWVKFANMSSNNTSNSIFEKILSFIDYTNQNIFLTGKAGTGKTTLLKRIRENTLKKMAVIAPTGVAAMNARGTTINSFFQLPPGSFFPGNISLENLQSGMLSIPSVVSDLSYTREKLNLFNELELLIIDEVSMVRCDLMDVIDAILRRVRKNAMPFGGVQLLLIGDLYQLPPVTKAEDWAFLSKAYSSPYFFEALAVRANPLLQIELTTVFRQTEPEFIRILNDIRNNQIDKTGLELLNKRYQPLFVPAAGLDPIIITSHNAEANAINLAKLNELAGEELAFEAEISGDFKDVSIQAEQSLKLKEGAQVMFIKNDTGDNRKFYNGKIGKVKSVKNGEIYISFQNEDDLLLEKSSWQSFEYKADPDQAIVQQQTGEFLQYPIKLAWAVTIHKSQGLTFDNAIIDAGKSFAAGQVYVALSRVRTLDGLILKSKINTESLRSNNDVLNYLKPVKEPDLEDILAVEQEKFILQIALNHFSFSRVLNEIDKMSSNSEIIKANIPEFKSLLTDLGKSAKDLAALSDRFQNQIRQLYDQNSFKNQQILQDRIESAFTYFMKEITIQLINPVNRNIRIKPKNKIQQHIQHTLQKFRQVLENRIALMQLALEILKEPIEQKDYKVVIEKYRTIADSKSRTSNNEPSISLQLF